MESPMTKRQKLCKTARSVDTLEKISDLKESDSIAIKYFQLDGICTKIDYTQLCAAREAISIIIGDADCSPFVGISHDVPAFCLPALMLGITSSGRAFAYLSSSDAKRVTEKLRISHFFTRLQSRSSKIMKNFQLHEEKMFLTKTEADVDQSEDSSSNEERQSLFAYATTTSGSTGVSKIVKVTHRSIIPNILDFKRIFNPTSEDAIAQITPLTFDPSIIEIFLSISSGSTLLTFADDLKNDPEALLKSLVDGNVTFLQITPSLLLQRWSSGDLRKSLLGEVTSLKCLLLGGEDFPNERLLSKIRTNENPTRIFDVYGVTEVSCWSSISEIRRNDLARKLGKPLSETIYEVRNVNGEKIIEGEGILHIGSNSRICVIDDENMEELNVPVFRDTGDIVEIDKNGEINLKGRSGRCVKRYGTRLYLAKLENRVEQLPFVGNCRALFNKNDQSLYIFFTIFDDEMSDDENIVEYENEVLAVTTKLSSVERPDAVALLNRFALTKNGKICDNYLRKKSAKLRQKAVSNCDDEKAWEIFADIWNRSLTSRDENSGFFDAGGTSVTAIRIVDEFHDKIPRRYPKLAGMLMKNDNLRICRRYISGERFFDESNVESVENHERLSAIKSQEFIDEKKRRFSDETRGRTRSEILPWQMCRGESNFPESSNGKMARNKLIIHRVKRYDLGKCVDASPTVFKYPGGKNYATVGSHAGIICTAELCKGNFGDCWKVSLPNRIEASVLVIHDFRGIVGTHDTFVYCFHMKTGEIFWKFKTSDIVKCTAVLCSRRKNIFFGSYDRKAYCVSVQNGSEIWSRKLSEGGIYATACTNDELNCVVFATLDGACLSLKQNNGEINWSIKSNYPIFSGPKILSGEIIVFCDVSGNLRFVSAITGEKIWREKIDGNVFSHLCVRTNDATRIDEIFLATETKKLYKIECSLDKRPIVRFTLKIDGKSSSTPFTDGRYIVVACNDGNLTFFHCKNGESACKFHLDGHVFSSPLIHDDFVVVGSRDDHFYVLSMCGEN